MGDRTAAADDAVHAVPGARLDESIDLRMLVRGAATLAHLWRELAAAS